MIWLYVGGTSIRLSGVVSLFTEGMLLRVYISETSVIDGQPAYRYLAQFFRKHGFPGCTVYRGLIGYGHEKDTKMFDVYRQALDIPVVVEVADTGERVMGIRDEVARLVEHGLVVTQPLSMCRKAP
jgi:PII-like signaling protein